VDSSAIFDGQGRLKPQGSERVYSEVDRQYFCLVQPELDLPARISSAFDPLGGDADRDVWVATVVTALEQQLMTIRQDPTMCGLLDGVHAPFVLPQTRDDFAHDFDSVLLPSVSRRYAQAFPGREFRNFSPVPLTGNCSIVEPSRWGLIPALRTDSMICGWYFPTALSGYAIPDQRTLVSRLPESLLLSGPSEVAAALICSPELMYKSDGKYGKLLALSSIEPSDPDQDYFFWFFESYGWDLEFNQRSFIGPVSEYFAGGITVLA